MKMDDEEDDRMNDAIKFKDFYINLIENNQKDLSYYLSSNIVLDWFGKTIKTRKMVTTYFRDKIGKITHDLNDVKFVDKIAFRDSHEIKIPKEESIMIISSSSSPTQSNHCNNNNNNNNNDNITPPPPPSSSILTTKTKQIEPSTSNSLECGQGDGIQNLLMSPCKKMKLLSSDNTDDDDDDNIKNNLKYLTTSGRIEFHRPSVKKFQTETKWERPIKLHIGYTSNNFKDCTIYLIIYESNLRCRRNLYKDFCENDKQQQQQQNDND